jgi:hypothetical protein
MLSCSEHLLPGYTNPQVLSKEFDILSLGILIMKIMGIPMAGGMQPSEIIELVWINFVLTLLQLFVNIVSFYLDI